MSIRSSYSNPNAGGSGGAVTDEQTITGNDTDNVFVLNHTLASGRPSVSVSRDFGDNALVAVKTEYLSATSVEIDFQGYVPATGENFIVTLIG